MARTTGYLTLNQRIWRAIAAVFALTAVVSSAAAQDASADADEVLYYWGTVVGDQLRSAGISDPREIEAIVRGLQDQAAGKAPEFGDEYRTRLNDFLVARSQQAAAAEAIESGKYVSQMAQETGATKTSSGIVFRELRAGDGPSATAESTVVVHYTGTLRDGSVFDSSLSRGEPLRIQLNQVIPCWTEAIPMLQVGGKAKITCPAELAYGELGNNAIPGGAALSFEVELLEVVN